MPGTLEGARETNTLMENIQEEGQGWKEKRMSEMKDGREGKLLIRWPGRQAWKKGFELSSGPEPCLLD